MIAEIISIGDELTSGQRFDTNSQWLSRQLGDLGLASLYHTTVADDLAANVARVSPGAERADFVVASGGLGPTADDLTRDALAAGNQSRAGAGRGVAGTHPRPVRRHKREMPERNRLQAMFPAGAGPIPIGAARPRASDWQPLGRAGAMPSVCPAGRAGRNVRNVPPGRGAGDGRSPARAAGDSASADQMLRRG